MENQKKEKVGYLKKAWGIVAIIENNPTYKKIFIGSVFVVLIFMFVSSPSSSSTEQVSRSVAVEVGAEGKVFLPEGGTIPIFATKELYEQYMKAVNANDQYGKLAVMSSGGFYPVKSGTKALVIERTMTMSKVRILEGVSTGKAGWTPWEFIVAE